MMSYYVEKSGKGFSVKEKGTNVEIIRKGKETEAREICRSLNLGSGFNGEIPNFFLRQYPYR